MKCICGFVKGGDKGKRWWTLPWEGKELEGVAAANMEYMLGWELEDWNFPGRKWELGDGKGPDPFQDGVSDVFLLAQMNLEAWTWGKVRHAHEKLGW